MTLRKTNRAPACRVLWRKKRTEQKTTVVVNIHTAGPSGRLSTQELMLLNRGAGEHSWESLGLQGVPTSNPKGNQPWIFTEVLTIKLKHQYFGHLMQTADSLEKTLMLGKIGSRRTRGWQDAMVGWHHRLNGREFEQAPRDFERQGSLLCCSPWGRKELDTV